MNRIKKIIINIIIIVVLTFIIMNELGFYFSPLAAHENSELSSNYGPTNIIHIEDFGNRKYILGTYDKWISCNTVNRLFLIFWTARGDATGFENDKKKGISYTWSVSGRFFKAYGIINDKRIKKIEITLSNGVILSETNFYQNLFLIPRKFDKNASVFISTLRGYDSENNKIFEEEY